MSVVFSHNLLVNHDERRFDVLREVEKQQDITLELDEGQILPVPPEMISHIFSFLDPKDLKTCSCLSKKWRKECKWLWKEKAKQLGITILKGEDPKAIVIGANLKNKKQLVKRIQRFIDSIQLNRSGNFICSFSANPKASLVITLRCSIHEQEQESILDSCSYTGPMILDDLIFEEDDNRSNKVNNHATRDVFIFQSSIVKALPRKFCVLVGGLLSRRYFYLKKMAFSELYELKKLNSKDRDDLLEAACAHGRQYENIGETVAEFLDEPVSPVRNSSSCEACVII